MSDSRPEGFSEADVFGIIHDGSSLAILLTFRRCNFTRAGLLLGSSIILSDLYWGVLLKHPAELAFHLLREVVLHFIDIREQYCSTCDARFLCNPCYIRFTDKNKLKYNEKSCHKYKKTIFRNMERYIQIKEDLK